MLKQTTNKKAGLIWSLVFIVSIFNSGLATAAPTLTQSAYRFSINADNTSPSFIANNLTTSDDTIRGTALDTVNGVFFTVGDNATNWVIEKRRIADGSLCTAANCGTEFGTAGRITEDIASSTSEKALAVEVDVGAGVIYIGGHDRLATNSQWRLEKRDLYTGALITGFGVAGVVISNPTAGDEEITNIILDKVNGYIFAGGFDNTGNNQWRIEKYRYSDGAICTAANCGTAFGTNGVYTNNQSNGDDRVVAIEIDPTNTFIYVSGFDAKNTRTQWTLYKLRANSAAACTAANCGTEFGTAGLYESNPTNRDDQVQALQVDSAANAIYIGGFESSSTTSMRWRIEKIDLNTAAKITSFGGTGCSTNVAGALCAAFSANNDKVYDMGLDGAGGFIYVIGIMDESGTDSQWRVQKRSRSDGSLVSTWATSGTASINPSNNQDPPNSLVVDTSRGLMWAMGGDRTLATTNMQWYFVPFNLDSGTIWLAPQDTIAVSSTNVSFRLRMLLHVATETMLTSGSIQLKLQAAPKNGTCDTAFIGEVYADVPSSGAGEILYHDNPSIAEGITTIAVAGDPAHGGDASVLQTLEEANNFSNTAADILSSQDGLWGFVVRDNSAFGAYCFRAVYADGSLISSYSVIPEITFCKNDPRTDNLLRHGTYFCEGAKRGFFWSQ